MSSRGQHLAVKPSVVLCMFHDILFEMQVLAPEHVSQNTSETDT